MAIYIIDNGTTYKDAIVALLKDYSPEVIGYHDLGDRVFTKQDTLVLTGGQWNPVHWRKDSYKDEYRLIRHHKGTIIGICLGFELIAHAYGSPLHHLRQYRKGTVTLHPSKRTALLPTSTTIDIFDNHGWSLQKVKRPLEALAYSEDGIEIIRHTRKPIYGLQFHPEKSSKQAAALFFAILNHALAPR